jgi:hypothetical protein
MRRVSLSVLVAALFAGGLDLAARPQASPFFPISEVRPGMVGIGRTVFAGSTIEEFKVNIIGVLSNINGPKRDLILARLDGGPLANTGVIQGMSGSPVHRRQTRRRAFVCPGFVSEGTLAGITPIEEMTSAMASTAPRSDMSDLRVSWPATPAAVYSALGKLAERAAMPLGGLQAVRSRARRRRSPTCCRRSGPSVSRWP